ncbi:MAG: glycerol-3-phosphate 1-O-acyltransferase [Proteobacteria bacterium]|nr:glycerol-3-phosphate 1-O-acyltransferase [Pseudomonadota bacterium]
MLLAENILFLAALVPFYLIGAFPTGMLLAKRRGIDLKTVGSGNVGATNVARALGKKAGLLTLGIDVSKGALAVALASSISDTQNFTGAAAVAAVMGHCFSIPGKLKGGKGVATALGCLSVLSPLSALGALVVFSGVLSWFRYVSLASVSAALFAPLVPLTLGRDLPSTTPIAAMALILTARHWANLQRLVSGQEPKFTNSPG